MVFGKSNVPLNLADFQSYNAVYGTTNNPWDLTRGPGGSSGGSAAMMAAGLSALEYGSDIGGSIRNPAAYCGVYGHKSTWCIVPKRGHSLAPKPGAEADLSVIGPLARSAGDLALALKLTVGADDAQRPRPAVYKLPAPPKSAEGPARRGLAGRAHRAGGRQRQDPHRSRGTCAGQGRRQGGLQGPARLSTRPHAHRVYACCCRPTWPRAAPTTPTWWPRARGCATTTSATMRMALRASTASFKEVFDANQQREHLRWAWHDFFGRHDLLLMPITATAAFPHDQSEPMPARTMRINGVERPYFGQLFWAGLATASFLPATVAPAGPDAPKACRWACRSSGRSSPTSAPSGWPSSWPS